MSEIDERHRELLRSPLAAEVRFVPVRGVALQLHRFSGATRDVDVTIAADTTTPDGWRPCWRPSEPSRT